VSELGKCYPRRAGPIKVTLTAGGKVIMSRGLGRVQWGCLLAIWRYEQRGEQPTTFDIAADIYHVEPDEDGYRIVSDAQHVAVKRALAGLQRQGRVVGFRTNTERLMRWRNPKSAG